ncbi:hypothetical protein C1H57_08270 [Clostridium sp. 2-1]|jgi:hypothetical protein|uniref:hypothetical protein n=1 Tax=Clostridium TaxID=1485 RepID=UPI000CDAA5FA|nr:MULTISPECIES: hypothetical protein [Clostridium]MBN7575400.1 hypothetical protein [Clostridium beijerinckii]MBN7580711.1 hypothetical protein [Clostridium beijerinckii]MBN7585164.1 hypothetical protein [Clostridium beijerinckii]MBO0522030.1 hypothetical protein [Clostridium beijerinckii]POO91804.1 hypothetical protein C1H57_08270 [Clostridium sp. 2-1]
MNTLIIYDITGTILSSPITGGYIKPTGELHYLELEIPEGKIIKSINTETKEPVLEDIPKSDIEKLQEQVNNLAQANAELTSIVAMGNSNA